MSVASPCTQPLAHFAQPRYQRVVGLSGVGCGREPHVVAMYIVFESRLKPGQFPEALLYF